MDNQSNALNDGDKSNSRPVSFYDNYGENGTIERRNTSDQNTYDTKALKFDVEAVPSQLYCLNTTVPQNIVVSNIAGRHTPTRNSLRHSRMIVMNKSGKVVRKSLPAIIRYDRLAKALVGLQMFLGVALCFLSLWLFLWSPNLRIRDNSYWSALPLLLSGFVGLFLLCCCNKECSALPVGYCVYFTKVLSIFLGVVSGAACLTASAFSVIHLISLSVMTCTPMHKLNETCVCKLNSNVTLPITSYHYLDLSCPEVDNILNILLIFSCVTNLIAGVISLWYVYIHWTSRYLYTYSKVRTKNDSPIVISSM